MVVCHSEAKTREDLPPLKEIRERCIAQLDQMRPDHMRRLNPTPYKVSTNCSLFFSQLKILKGNWGGGGGVVVRGNGVKSPHQPSESSDSQQTKLLR